METIEQACRRREKWARDYVGDTPGHETLRWTQLNAAMEVEADHQREQYRELVELLHEAKGMLATAHGINDYGMVDKWMDEVEAALSKLEGE